MQYAQELMETKCTDNNLAGSFLAFGICGKSVSTIVKNRVDVNATAIATTLEAAPIDIISIKTICPGKAYMKNDTAVVCIALSPTP